MESVALVIHLIFAVSIIILVLLQRSEGGGLGIGGGSGGSLGGFASAKGTANALTKLTALCATGFFITSLTLGVLAAQHSKETVGLLENVDTSQIESSIDDVSAPVGGVTSTTDKIMDSNKDNIGDAKKKNTSNKDNKDQNDNKSQKEEPLAPIE